MLGVSEDGDVQGSFFRWYQIITFWVHQLSREFRLIIPYMTKARSCAQSVLVPLCEMKRRKEAVRSGSGLSAHIHYSILSLLFR